MKREYKGSPILTGKDSKNFKRQIEANKGKRDPEGKVRAVNAYEQFQLKIDNEKVFKVLNKYHEFLYKKYSVCYTSSDAREFLNEIQTSKLHD